MSENGAMSDGTGNTSGQGNAGQGNAAQGSVGQGDVEQVSVEQVVARAQFGENGLLPAIVQQEGTGEVLMLGYMNAEALRRTLTEGRVTFWSRSRQEYWRKGDTSGNRQYVRGAALDCDSDALLLTVDQVGPACHTGAHSCFDVDPLSPKIGTWDEHITPESSPELSSANETLPADASAESDAR